MRFALAAVAALALASPAAGAPLKTKTAQLGSVRATVSWQPAKYFQAKDVRLVLTRDGHTVLTRKLGPAIPQAIRIRDLDGDGEGEVLLDLYTGGAHCCYVSRIYRYVAGTYIARKYSWGDPSYSLGDLNGDGLPEFVTADDAFAYAFTAYAGSALPVRVWTYRTGRMINVTRHFPGLIRKNAASLWKEYAAQRKSDFPDPRGILAAWMADEYLLGQQAKGWATMRRLNAKREFRGIGGGDIWAKNAVYLAKLKAFLRNYGYARKS